MGWENVICSLEYLQEQGKLKLHDIHEIKGSRKWRENESDMPCESTIHVSATSIGTFFPNKSQGIMHDDDKMFLKS